MNEIGLTRQRRARVWINEPPDGFDASGSSRRTLCVEAFVPKGPMMMYGLLGGSWDAAGPLHGVVIDTDKKVVGKAFVPLSSAVGDVQPGAPDALLVAAEGRASKEVLAVNPGELRLVWSAYSAIWSNELLFGALGDIIAAGLVEDLGLAAVSQLLEVRLP